MHEGFNPCKQDPRSLGRKIFDMIERKKGLKLLITMRVVAEISGNYSTSEILVLSRLKRRLTTSATRCSGASSPLKSEEDLLTQRVT